MSEDLIYLFNSFCLGTFSVYSIYMLNRNYGKVRPSLLFSSVLLIAIPAWLSRLFFPDSSLGLFITIGVDILLITCLWKHNIFSALITTCFITIIAFVSDIVIVVLYLIPFRITMEAFHQNLLHTLVGGAFEFATTFVFLKLFGNKLIALRDATWLRNKKLMIILTSNFLLFLFWGCICLVFLQCYLHNGTLFSNLAMLMAGFSFFLATLFSAFLINGMILAKFKYIDIKLIDSDDLDNLTGVLNRKAGLGYLEQQLALSSRQNTSLTICFLDINNLKMINDTYGHQQGDQLIISVIELIKSNLRKSDQIARLGGDEFLIVFPSSTATDAEAIAKRALMQLENKKFALNSDYIFSFSYGFAESAPESPRTSEQLLKLADQEMYNFKRFYKENHYMI